jgi:hypothetical protein
MKGPGASRDLPTYVVGPDSFKALTLEDEVLYIHTSNMSNVQDVVNNNKQHKLSKCNFEWNRVESLFICALIGRLDYSSSS